MGWMGLCETHHNKQGPGRWDRHHDYLEVDNKSTTTTTITRRVLSALGAKWQICGGKASKRRLVFPSFYLPARVLRSRAGDSIITKNQKS